MNRMPSNARMLESLGDSIYRDENGNIRIKAPIVFENNLPLFNVLQNITDDYGNRRFVEGSVKIENSFNGTISYNKWSLSGSHLMIVIAGEITAGTYNTATLFSLSTDEIPSWILDKIKAISENYVEFKTLKLWISYVTSDFNLEIRKNEGDKELYINPISEQTISNNSKFRLQLDFLIDLQ